MVVGAPVISEPYPVGGQPAIAPHGQAPGAAPAPAGNVLFEGALSRDKKIAPKEIHTIDGIEVKIKSTSSRRLEAYLQVRVGRSKEKHKDLPIGSSIPVVGLSGQMYYVHLIDIDVNTRTVWFAIVQ